MLISIIVPVYNTEKYLSKCIDSILAQTYTDFELLLIDDGSTDKSCEICDEYAEKDKRIRVFHKANGGASSARNIGIDNAEGEWVCFVDSDDYIEPSYMETLSSIDDKADVTFFPIRKITETGDVELHIPKACKVNDRTSVEEKLSHLKYGLPVDMFGWTCNKLFRADIIKDNGVRFPEDVVFREDEIFMMVYSRYITSLEIIDTPLYNYMQVPDGITANGMRDADYIALADHILENISFYNNEKLLSGDKRRIIDYRVQHVLKNKTKMSLINAYRPLYAFIHEHKDLMQYSSYKYIMRVLSYPYWLACICLHSFRMMKCIKRRFV